MEKLSTKITSNQPNVNNENIHSNITEDTHSNIPDCLSIENDQSSTKNIFYQSDEIIQEIK